MHHPNIDRKAAEVAAALNEGNTGPHQFDPATLIAIITALFQLFKNCNQSPQDIERRAAEPRLLDRVRLRRLVRQNAGANWDDIEAALLDAGQDLTAGEALAMLGEV